VQLPDLPRYCTHRGKEGLCSLRIVLLGKGGEKDSTRVPRFSFDTDRAARKGKGGRSEGRWLLLAALLGREKEEGAPLRPIADGEEKASF